MRSKRLLIPTLLLIAAVVFAVYTYRQSAELEAELVRQRQHLAELSDTTQAYHRLIGADSLLLANDYAAARDAYQRLTQDTLLATLGRVDLDERIAHTVRIIRLNGLLDTLRLRAARGPQTEAAPLALETPAPVRRMPLEESNPSQYDSLTFALRKANMRIQNLEGRLRRNSGGNYLTFTSTKGNEVYYVGDVRRGMANGSGVALLSSGSRYLGEWKDNMKHGSGEFHWPDGAWYEGQYEEDERSGEGTYHFPGGETFVGEWEGDVRNGQGVFYDADGEVVAQGIWEEDELVQ